MSSHEFGMKIYHGNNCHADIVLDGFVDQDRLGEVKKSLESDGFEVTDSAILGHFAVRGADYDSGHDAKLSKQELEILGMNGELIFTH